MIASSSRRVPESDKESYEHLSYDEDDYPVPASVAVSEQEVGHLHYRYLRSCRHAEPSPLSPAFPPDALQIVRLMMGNQQCADCMLSDYIRTPNGEDLEVEPLFAAVSYGTLLCRRCAVAHLQRDDRENVSENRATRLSVLHRLQTFISQLFPRILELKS
jgi:hypothetical protein